MTTDDAIAAAREAVKSHRADGLVERLAERLGARASVEAVFGTPIASGELTVVPVARVRYGFGGGGGADEAEGRGGSGGGGGVSAEPIGYLEIRPTGAAFQPIGRTLASPAFVLSAAFAAAIVIRALARLR
jgi:uncharacterized spore protein YtfJ